MVLGPTRPFALEELAALERYVKGNGHLLLALDPSAILPPDVADAAATTPQVEDEAETAEPGQPGDETGQARPTTAAAEATASEPESEQDKPEDATEPADASGMVSGLQALAHLAQLELVVDPLASETRYLARRYNKSDRVQLFTNRFSSHAAVSTLSRNSTRAAVVFFSAGSFEPGEGSTFVTDFAVKTLPKCFRDTNRNYEHDSGEKEGVFNFAAAVSNKSADSKPPGQEGKDGAEQTRVFAVADADVFTDLILANAMTNQLFFVDIVRWLGGEESYAGEISSEEDVRIEHTREKDVIWFYATIFGAPALVLGLGLVLARRSRRPKGGKR
jgi:hypothetical protein